MPYLPLPNFNYDSGARRIQSGPDHEGYVVLYSGVQADGADEGFVVAGSPLSGTTLNGAWDYDGNWRYVPGVLPDQSGSIDPTPYNASGAILDTYKGTRIATRTQVAGAQAADAIGSEANVVNPRGGALQPRASVTQPEKYMYFGGAAPDNQGYSPYNTPDANTPAEGRTGGPVTHRNYENTLITNVFGTQGTSDRSQWRYHQPVYCKTYTETLRSQSPGLMSTPLRYVYRNHSTSYGINYGGQFALNANGAGVGGGGVGNGFQQLPYDEFGGGCDIPPPCPTTTGDPLNPQPGDVLTGSSYCTYVSITWYNTGSDTPIGTGETYTIQESDYFYNIYYVVEYPNGSKESSSLSCLNTVAPDRNYDFWALSVPPQSYLGLRNPYKILLDKYGNTYIIFHYINQVQFVNVAIYATLVIQKRDIDGVELWTKKYDSDEGLALYTFTGEHPVTFDDNQEYIYCSIEFRQYITQGFGPYWDGIQVYKINSQTGELVWRHKYNPRMQNVRTNSGLFFDAYLNSVWVAATDLSLSYLFRIDADDPSNVISGLTMSYVGNNSITTYVGYSTLIRSHDNNKLYVIWIDGSNRHVIFELNSTGTSINSTVKRVSASTTLKEGGTIPCKFIKVKLADNSNAYIGGMGFSNYANALVLYDENFNAVKRTGSLGNIKSIEVDPEDNKKMYGIAYGTSNANLSSFDIRFGNNALVSSFTADTDLTTVSTCTAFTTTSGYNWIADNARTSDYGIATNNLVNRAVIALSSYDNGGSFDGRGSISGFFTLGMPLTSSGNTTNFAWPNPSGLIAGRLNQSYALTGVSPAVSGLVASGGSHIVQASGEANTTVQDITGTSIEIYATSSFL